MGNAADLYKSWQKQVSYSWEKNHKEVELYITAWRVSTWQWKCDNSKNLSLMWDVYRCVEGNGAATIDFLSCNAWLSTQCWPGLQEVLLILVMSTVPHTWTANENPFASYQLGSLIKAGFSVQTWNQESCFRKACNTSTASFSQNSHSIK